MIKEAQFFFLRQPPNNEHDLVTKALKRVAESN
jgi:hypothetical protein